MSINLNGVMLADMRHERALGFMHMVKFENYITQFGLDLYFGLIFSSKLEANPKFG